MIYPLIRDLFLRDTLVRLEENSHTFNSKSDLQPFQLSGKDIHTILTSAFGTDQVQIDISVGGREAETVSTATQTDAEIAEFLRLIGDQVRAAEANDRMTVEVTIKKKRSDGCFAIYSFDAWLSFLNSQDASQQVQHFWKCSNEGEFTRIRLETPFSTYSTLLAFSSQRIDEVRQVIDRSRVRLDALDLRRAAPTELDCLIPEDFEFGSRCPQKLIDIARKLRTIVAVSYVADSCNLIGNSLVFSIRGYRKLDIEIDVATTDWQRLAEFYRLYQWVYAGGSVSDKLGIVRNLISLNFDKSRDDGGISGLLDASRSNHAIFLQKNVAIYFEQKGKLEAAVADLLVRGLAAASVLSANLKANLTGFVALFVSVIIGSAVKTGNVANLGSPVISVLGFSFVVFSCIYLILSMVLFWVDFSRMEAAYERLKKRFSSILDEKDCKRILDDDGEYKTTKSYVRVSAYTIIIVWILAILGIALLMLAGEQNSNGLSTNPLEFITFDGGLSWYRRILNL